MFSRCFLPSKSFAVLDSIIFNIKIEIALLQLAQKFISVFLLIIFLSSFCSNPLSLDA